MSYRCVGVGRAGLSLSRRLRSEPVGQTSACRGRVRGLTRLPALFALLLVAASCGGGGNAPSGTPVAPTNGALTVRAFEWGFDPSNVILQPGQQVRLTFVNDGSTLHDLKIDGLDATGVSSEGSGLSADEGELFVAADEGKTGTLAFTPAEPGTFDFYCTIPRHRDLGMKGAITVQ